MTLEERIGRTGFDPNKAIEHYQNEIEALRAKRMEMAAEWKSKRGHGFPKGLAAINERIGRFQRVVRRLRWFPGYQA